VKYDSNHFVVSLIGRFSLRMSFMKIDTDSPASGQQAHDFVDDCVADQEETDHELACQYEPGHGQASTRTYSEYPSRAASSFIWWNT